MLVLEDSVPLVVELKLRDPILRIRILSLHFLAMQKKDSYLQLQLDLEQYLNLVMELRRILNQMLELERLQLLEESLQIFRFMFLPLQDLDLSVGSVELLKYLDLIRQIDLYSSHSQVLLEKHLFHRQQLDLVQLISLALVLEFLIHIELHLSMSLLSNNKYKKDIHIINGTRCTV